MRAALAVAIACLTFASCIDAATLKGSIQFAGQFDASVIASSSRVLLDHGSHQALIRKDGSFEMHNVPEGRHVLSSSVPGFVLQPLTVTVTESTTHVQPFHPGREPLPTSSTSMAYPIQLTLLGREDYFTQPQALNIFGMLRNPMVLMMLVSGALMWGMPKLMASMELDEDMKKEMAQTRKKMQGYQNMDLTKSLSSMLAGESEADPQPAPGPTASTVKKRGRK